MILRPWKLRHRLLFAAAAILLAMHPRHHGGILPRAASSCFFALLSRKIQNPNPAMMAHPATGPTTAPAIQARLPLSLSESSWELLVLELVDSDVAEGAKEVIDGPGVGVVSGPGSLV
jgi:hypothetical protein